MHASGRDDWPHALGCSRSSEVQLGWEASVICHPRTTNARFQSTRRASGKKSCWTISSGSIRPPAARSISPARGTLMAASAADATFTHVREAD